MTSQNHSNLRLLGLDPGSKRIGLAVWNPQARLARPLSVLTRKTISYDIEFLRKIIETEEIQAIVLGWPVALSGNETSSTDNARFWESKLIESFGLPVFPQDEALSSKEALKDLKDLKVSKKKEKLDSIAAAYILEEFVRVEEEKTKI